MELEPSNGCHELLLDESSVSSLFIAGIGLLAEIAEQESHRRALPRP